jgi:hypothetical protein
MRTTEHLGLFVPEGDDFYFGEDGPEQDNPDIIDAAMKDHEERVVTLEGKTDSFYADFEAYYGNTKLIDDFQDIDGRTVGSEDTINVKIGSKSLKIEEINNISGSIVSDYNNLPTFNLGTFNNGLTSSVDDYVVLVAYVSDATKVTNLGFGLSPEPTYNASNNANKTISAGIVTGWNYFKIKKIEIAGVADINSDMKSIRMFWTSISNAQGAYVSFQLLQLVKKDPLADYPNPYQKNGVRELELGPGDWYIGKEDGRLIIKGINTPANETVDMKGQNLYKDFTLYQSKLLTYSSYDCYVSWGIDASNRITLYLNSSKFKMVCVIDGVGQISPEVDIVASPGDIISYRLEKKGNKVLACCTVNGKEYYLNEEYPLNDKKGYILQGQHVTSSFNGKLLSLSISEIPHAHHANIAEVAKSLTKQPFAEFYLSSNQSVPNDDPTNTVVLFDRKYKENNMLKLNDDGTVTVNESGNYIIIVNARWAIQSNGIRGININNGGSYTMGRTRLNAVATDETEFNAVASGEFKKNDKIIIKPYQDSGAPLSLLGQYRDFTNMTVIKVG